MFVRRVIVAILLLAPLETLAFSGNELHNHCADEHEAGFSYCLGYISGVLDADEAHYVTRVTLSQTKAAEEEQMRKNCPAEPSLGQITKKAVDQFFLEKRDYCLPTKSTLRQIKAIFLKYISVNPEKTHLPADRLLREALGAAFPCK